MKILYDHQAFSRQEYGGVSRYFVELMANIRQFNMGESEVSIKYSNNHYLRSAKLCATTELFERVKFRGRNYLIEILNKRITRRRLAALEFDIFHPTYYHPYFLEQLGSKPYVLTIFDMIHEKFARYFHDDNTAMAKRLVARKAAKIITISESSKKDIIHFLEVPAEKVKVIYLASSMILDDNVARFPVPLPQKYILFVGSRDIYKNFHKFVRAIVTRLKNDTDLHLVCVGGGEFKKDESLAFEKIGCASKILRVTVDDKLLPEVYKKAVCLVMPSLYEGFGIPMIEAFACGCPVVASNSSSLPEIGGDAGVYFDPENIDSMRETIDRVLDGRELREEKSAKGLLRAQKFSWRKTAAETMEVYKTVVGNGGHPCFRAEVNHPRSANQGPAATVLQAPLFSVLIASYNRPEYLAKCLRSIFDGEHGSFEVLVSDDCSPEADKIKEVAGRYAGRGNFKFYEHKINIGMAANWNFLAKHAKGQYLLYVGDDDELTPHSLTDIEKNILAHPGCDVYGIGYDIIDERDNLCITKVAPRFFEISQNSPAALLHEFFVAGIIPFWTFHPFSLCYKRSITDEISYEPKALIGADLLFLFDCVNKSKKIGVIPQSLFRWRKVQGLGGAYRNLSASAASSVMARKSILNILLDKKCELAPAVRKIIEAPGFKESFYAEPLGDSGFSADDVTRTLRNISRRRILRLKQFIVFGELFGLRGIMALVRMSFQVLRYKIRWRSELR